MPLPAENPLSFGGAFDGFDDSVLGRAGHHPQRIAQGGDRLVMTGVDGDVLSAGERSERGAGLDLGRVLDNVSARRARGGSFLHGGVDVLNQRSVAPYVERLGSVADG